ncbi:MAG: phenylalanine--tRNA ligase subunit alpha, partial [Xanthomonadales bacterium]|nr:phenylalanine--tRNA ligase subunit alpha [Xanthomonadales bacterium]
MNSITDIQERALAEIEASSDLRELDELRVRYLGKKGEITAQLKALGTMEPEQRRSFGQAVNAARDGLNRAIQARRQALETSELDRRLMAERVDVTLPVRGEQRGGLHPVTMAMERAIGIFTKLGFDV